ARTEAFLAADIERDLRLEPVFAVPQETRQTAEMIIVAVAQHEGVEARRIDAQKFKVVEERVRGEAEIDNQVAHLGATVRFDMHRQAEFADDRPARRLVAERPAEALDLDVLDRGARSDGNLVAVDDRAHEQAIYLGHRAG